MKYKRVLVTGGAGFIGSHIIDLLINNGYSVRVLDNLDPQVHPGRKKPSYLNSKAEFVLGDVTKRKDWLNAISGIDVVFHEASAVGVGQSMYKIEYYTKTNTLGTALLLDILANNKHSIKKIIVAASMSSYGEGAYVCKTHKRVRPGLRSTDQVKDGVWEPVCPYCRKRVGPVGIKETDIQQCNSIYAITKKDQEDMIMLFGKAYGIPTVALRYFNVFGPRQSLSNPYTGVAAIFLSRLAIGSQPVIYEDGEQTRDFVSVHDIAKANLFALESEKANGEIFNVGSGERIQIKQIAEILANKLNVGIKPDITGKFRVGDVRHCFSDINKIERLLNFKPSISFEFGVDELINWSAGEKIIDKFDEAVKELKSRKLV
ncbi:nucleoside-diphosphate-sugar epimerase [Candidatus Woesebacteria bacterium RIFCSPHIGHO2_02_FULL_38_9]|nr:MAG: nucleoside-diphosphate-sugar epimerase [Candidatus Woesebacteria bacterium RIFCSPHIGHO2_02_FULL_38_9]OGM57834.1 MAG: nucleoside-diphosphate-sugar epimerase [Candidatus Woesebacteria bacterium RIFCSPLOWO2_01_FULL_38_20]